MARKKKAPSRKPVAPRAKRKSSRKTPAKARSTARLTAGPKPSTSKRRGRPPGSKNKTTTAKKKRAPRGSLMAKLLERERRIKRRWHDTARRAKQMLHDLQLAHKAAEQRAAEAARITEAREKALQSFAEKWDRKYSAKLAQKQRKATLRQGVHRKRRRRSA